jgi:vanillate O-demethylase monooxygenase subunit
VGHLRPLARTIIGEPIALFRTSKGKPVAFEDRCPHRRMPLSLGRITDDDRLICAYHGLTFDEAGTCVSVPGQSTTYGISVRTFPVKERWGCVWVWLGDAQSADLTAIFDCSWLDQPGVRLTKLYRHAKANYLLLNDNLADLLHVAYLHLPSGGGNEFMGAAQSELKIDGTGYHFTRETLNIPSPASYGRLANAKRNVDRWHVVDFKGPSFYRIYTGVAETGSGGPKSTLPQGAGRWTILPHHLITPETENTLHYFQIVGHEWIPSSDFWRFQNQVIDEDVWAIEQQQRNIDLRPDAPTNGIASDGPMLAMHRIVEQMLQAEAQRADHNFSFSKDLEG